MCGTPVRVEVVRDPVIRRGDTRGMVDDLLSGRVTSFRREQGFGVITLDDGLLSEVLGTPAEVGESWRFRVGLSSYEIAADLRGRSTMRGRFSYDHAPAVD